MKIWFTYNGYLISDCLPSMTTVNGQVQCRGELIFEENFDELNANKWRKEKRFSRDPVRNIYAIEICI